VVKGKPRNQDWNKSYACYCDWRPGREIISGHVPRNGTWFWNTGWIGHHFHYRVGIILLEWVLPMGHDPYVRITLNGKKTSTKLSAQSRTRVLWAGDNRSRSVDWKTASDHRLLVHCSTDWAIEGPWFSLEFFTPFFSDQLIILTSFPYMSGISPFRMRFEQVISDIIV
jgi:hypothetical protein